jgi:hypothetical protein
MSAALLDIPGPVYATKKGARFHETPDCAAMLAGQIGRFCRCGDRLCGHWVDRVPKPRHVSLNLAALEGLKPCAACFPGFAELDVQLPADEDFGHNRKLIDNDWFCARCTTPYADEYGDRRKCPTLWPCTSAVVLNLAAAEGMFL